MGVHGGSNTIAAKSCRADRDICVSTTFAPWLRMLPDHHDVEPIHTQQEHLEPRSH